jgi:hypothetical protein
MPSRANSQDSNMGAEPPTVDIGPNARMSPRTVASTLQSHPNLEPNILRALCTGLCNTLEARGEQTQARNQIYEERIEELEMQLDRARHPHTDDAPDGFKPNDDKYPMLYITTAPNEIRPAYWIRECADGKVLGRYRGQSLEEDSWVFDVYAQPLVDASSPITAIPSWYRHMVLNSSSGFATLLDATASADHPGLYAEVLRWRRIDETLRAARGKLDSIEGDILSLQVDMGLCEGRLVQAQAHTHVAHLEALAKSSARAHFTALKACKKEGGSKQGRFV